MACQVHTWSLSGLVAAFLNLAIAYLLLCVSAVTFFASKFLGFFGLHLPCPCKSIPSRDNCLNRLLVDFPAQQVSNVQLSVKEKFPFNDSIWERNHNNNIGADNCANGILEIEGDASCSSVSDVRQSRNVVGRDFVQWGEEYDVKGKEVISYRPRSRLHRRSRKGGVDHGKYSAASSYDPSLHEEILGSIPHSHSSSNKGGDGITQGITLPVDYGGAYHIESIDDMHVPIMNLDFPRVTKLGGFVSYKYSHALDLNSCDELNDYMGSTCRVTHLLDLNWDGDFERRMTEYDNSSSHDGYMFNENKLFFLYSLHEVNFIPSELWMYTCMDLIFVLTRSKKGRNMIFVILNHILSFGVFYYLVYVEVGELKVKSTSELEFKALMEHVGDSTYRLEFKGKHVGRIILVITKLLHFCVGSKDLRTNLFQEGEDDAIMVDVNGFMSSRGGFTCKEQSAEGFVMHENEFESQKSIIQAISVEESREQRARAEINHRPSATIASQK